MYSPEADSSPAPSSLAAEQQNQMMSVQHGTGNKQQSSRGNSFEIENLLKTAEQVCNI